MKITKIITMLLALLMWLRSQTMSAQITDSDIQDDTYYQTADQEMVTDAWERDWDNMDDQERQSFRDEWNNSTNASERQQRRQQELNNMSTQERDKHDRKLRERRNEWQSMSSNERDEFGQRVQDYNNNASNTNSYNRR